MNSIIQNLVKGTTTYCTLCLLVISLLGCGNDETSVQVTVPAPAPTPVPIPTPEDTVDTSGLREVKMDDLDKDIALAMKYAFEGGATEEKEDVTVDNVRGKEDQADDGR